MAPVNQKQMERVPYVTCPHCPGGWLISYQHRECFDRIRHVWHFTCPDCGGHFDKSDMEIKVRNIPLKDIRQRYPRFGLQSNLIPSTE